VAMIIIGCAFFILDRIMPGCGKRFRLQLWSGLLLMIGSSVWCICGISWSTRLCDAIFEGEPGLIDQCWVTSFINFLAVSCSVLYLTMSVIDDLFSPKARFAAIVLTNILLLLHLVLYLVLHGFRRIETMTIKLQFYYYIIIAYLGLTTAVSLTYSLFGHPQLSKWGMASYSGFSAFLTFCLVFYGSYNFWYDQSLNVGDAAAFVGYTIFYTSANIWVFIELRLYQIDRMANANRALYETVPNADGKIEAQTRDSLKTPAVSLKSESTESMDSSVEAAAEFLKLHSPHSDEHTSLIVRKTPEHINRKSASV